MAKFGSIELPADRDVFKGQDTRLITLFTSAAKTTEFELLENITRDTPIRVTIAKVGSFEIKAGESKNKGEKTNSWALLKLAGFSKGLNASEEIKKGDKLTITFETL